MLRYFCSVALFGDLSPVYQPCPVCKDIPVIRPVSVCIHIYRLVAEKSLLGIIGSVDHWVAFLLLVYIGVKMIREGLENKEEVCIDVRKTRILITVSVATSIDALAVGIGLAMTSFTFNRILIASAIILAVTAIAASAGLKGGDISVQEPEEGLRYLAD